jgi:hypothetical protein
MPEHDKDLISLFVRDLDRVELPPRGRWRPSPRKESRPMRAGRYLMYGTAVAAVLVLALVAGLGLREGGAVGQRPTATPMTSTPVPAATPTPSPSPSPGGAITGALAYHTERAGRTVTSNYVPPFTVYALSVDDHRKFFSVDTPRYEGNVLAGTRPSYTISGVAPGTYYVLAFRNDDVSGDRQAKDSPPVHSRYVLECIQPVERSAPQRAICRNDHSLVPVTVRAGETVTGIDVTDWDYDEQTTYPPRPSPTARP